MPRVTSPDLPNLVYEQTAVPALYASMVVDALGQCLAQRLALPGLNIAPVVGLGTFTTSQRRRRLFLDFIPSDLLAAIVAQPEPPAPDELVTPLPGPPARTDARLIKAVSQETQVEVEQVRLVLSSLGTILAHRLHSPSASPLLVSGLGRFNGVTENNVRQVVFTVQPSLVTQLRELSGPT